MPRHHRCNSGGLRNRRSAAVILGLLGLSSTYTDFLDDALKADEGDTKRKEPGALIRIGPRAGSQSVASGN